ncbi:hypothetical protein [Plastoroseomonas arctica]|uniref:Uncharacterized protein n=1 Tax=Plastoroseomonas arctica TaxID=1509237 RepID=A0AAF1K190_9PROT|nr:hypothetical protein [Plastoroseomonas arctica]MBR0655053.1 hypothetical protein [Plastoroseomonas arctica]
MTATANMIFADGMSDIAIANGVARITLAQTGAEGKTVPVAQLCVPVTQLPALANGLVQMLKQLQEKAQAAAAAAVPTAPQQENPPQLGGPTLSPGAFRFGDKN